MPPLIDTEITAGLTALPGWAREGNEIVKTFDCGSFAAAIAFVVRIGFFAERADHHPDLDVRWKHVRVALTTHDSGGLTNLDLDLAREIEAIGPDVPLTIAILFVVALLGFLLYAIAHERRPGAADVAMGYEHAWDELNFGLLWDLSGEELREGMRRDQFIEAKTKAYANAERRGRLADRIEVDTFVEGNQSALVVTCISAEGTSVRNDVLLERRANGWVVVGYSLRPTSAAREES